MNCTRTAACKRTQQLPTLLRKQCWELLRAYWQRCANGCNNSKQCWDPQCIVGRIKPISVCKPCVMSVRGPNNAGRAVQTDPTLLRYASAIPGQKKCWELLAEKFDRFQTWRNILHVTSNNVVSVCTGLSGFASLACSSIFEIQPSKYLSVEMFIGKKSGSSL